jgi:hypothetical protein
MRLTCDLEMPLWESRAVTKAAPCASGTLAYGQVGGWSRCRCKLALAAHGDFRSAARPARYVPVRGGYAAQCPGYVTAMADFMFAGLE